VDFSVNKVVKHMMKKEFITWYSDEVQLQLSRGNQIDAVKVYLRLSLVKLVSAQ